MSCLVSVLLQPITPCISLSLKRNSRSLYLGRMFSGVPVVRLRFRRRIQTGWESHLQQLSPTKNSHIHLVRVRERGMKSVSSFLSNISVWKCFFNLRWGLLSVLFDPWLQKWCTVCLSFGCKSCLRFLFLFLMGVFVLGHTTGLKSPQRII